MSKLPVMNVTARTMGKGRPQAWVAMVALDAIGNGVLQCVTSRCMPSDEVAELVDQHIANGGTFAATEDGVRFVTNGVDGTGAPCFITRQGFGTGQLYLFGGLKRKAAILDALGTNNVGAVADQPGKDGLYVTLTKGANMEHVYKVLSGPLCLVSTKPKAYDSGMGAPKVLEGVSTESIPAPMPKVEKTKGEGKKGAKGKKGKNEGAKDEVKATEGEQAAS